MAVVNQETSLTRREDTMQKAERRTILSIIPFVLGILSFVGMMISLWAIFLYAPTDALQGDTQRIFYFHVPLAWIAMLAFTIVAIASVAYLWKRDERWDWLACAAAELGAVFTTLALITGSLWGRPIWGTWWTWDARLTTTLILWFLYIGYLILRSYMGHTASAARAAAVLGIIGFIDIPIIHMSVVWWRTLHPQAVVLNGSSPALPPEMLLTLVITLITFTLLYSFLMTQLYQLQRIQAQAQRLRASVEE